MGSQLDNFSCGNPIQEEQNSSSMKNQNSNSSEKKNLLGPIPK